VFIYNDGGREKAGYQGRTGDCVTRAIAIALELPYEKVYADLHALLKADKKQIESGKTSPRQGVPKQISRKYLAGLGWEFVPTMGIGTGCKVHLKPNELPRGRIIAKVSKHMVAVIDGVIHDTHDCARGGTRCVYGYYSKKAVRRQIF
jgi:hypothetical protein